MKPHFVQKCFYNISLNGWCKSFAKYTYFGFLFLLVHVPAGKFPILGKYSNNQNGNLRWFSPLGVGPPPQWAKSGGEAVLLQFSDFTKDPMLCSSLYNFHIHVL